MIYRDVVLLRFGRCALDGLLVSQSSVIPFIDRKPIEHKAVLNLLTLIESSLPLLLIIWRECAITQWKGLEHPARGLNRIFSTTLVLSKGNRHWSFP